MTTRSTSPIATTAAIRASRSSRPQRLRAENKPAGDCIDCHQCVAVCPTGIDIRDGAAARLHPVRPLHRRLRHRHDQDRAARLGLIAYDTDDNVQRRISRRSLGLQAAARRAPMIYAALITVVGGAMLYQLATRRTAEMSILHDRAPLFVTLSDGSIRNAYTLRLLNKRPDSRPFALTVAGHPGHPDRDRRHAPPPPICGRS